MKVEKPRRVIIKIGSNVLTQSCGLLDEYRISHLARQIAFLESEDIEVILVSSGAVACGRGLIKLNEKLDPVDARQLLAAVGQVKLIDSWSARLAEWGLLSAQVLVTKEDFRDKIHYYNIRNCLGNLIKNKVIPIVNENDVVAVTELMFTDNDELAGLVAAMLNADSLIILSNVDGIFDGHPEAESSRVIPEINGTMSTYQPFIFGGRSNFGRGGMRTKLRFAVKAAALGIRVHIANGTRENVLTDLIKGRLVHTWFAPSKPVSSRKKQIAHIYNNQAGQVIINDGALAALCGEKAASLLPVGVTKIDGEFQKGDIIRIANTRHHVIGYGMARYSSVTARDKIGKKNQSVLVHYDHMHVDSELLKEAV